MEWIAPYQKDETTSALEDRLWKTADQLRANSGLTAAQYSGPVLGLIFLRFADVRFQAKRKELEKQGGSSRRRSPAEDPQAYIAAGVIYLPESARFETLLNLPEGTTIGAIVRGSQVIIAHHDTVIEPEDHVILFLTDKNRIYEVEKLFQDGITFI